MIYSHFADHFTDPLTWAIIEDDDELRGLVEGSRRIARKEILPKAADMERDGKVYHELVDLMAKSNFFSVSIPKDYGGMDLGNVGDCILAYEIAYGDMSASLVPAITMSIFGRAVNIGGTEEQKNMILPKVASGELFGCFALTESGGSSFSGSIKTTARKKGEKYLLNGEKLFTTEAERAHYAMVFAGVDGTENGVGAFLVPNGRHSNGKGYVVSGKEDKAGLRASATCTISMQDVEVPQEDLLGLDFSGEQGLKTALKTLGWSRPVVAAQALGNAKGALAYVMEYALDTPRGDGSAYLVDLPHYQIELAVMLVKLKQGLSYLWGVAKSLDRSGGNHSRALRVYSSTLKAIATDDASEICRKCMGMIGGAGYSKDHPLEKRWRDSGAPPIYEGQNLLLQDHAGKDIAAELKKFRA